MIRSTPLDGASARPFARRWRTLRDWMPKSGIATLAVVALALPVSAEKSTGAPEPTPADKVTGVRDPARATEVQGEIRAMMEATYGGDAATVLKFMHSSVIEAIGGEAAAKREVAAALEQVKRLSIVVEELEFPDEPRFFAGVKRNFVVAPTRIVVAAGAQRAEVLSFQVGVRGEADERWTYIEGGKFTPSVRSELFPDFPSGVVLPPISRQAQ